MYNQLNFRRDCATGGILLAIAAVVATGGAMADKTEDNGKLNAGATIEVESAQDPFQRSGQNAVTPVARSKSIEKQQHERSQVADQREINSEPQDDLFNENVPDSGEPQPQKSEERNLVEPDAKPLNELTPEEIEQRVADYRAWVLVGEPGGVLEVAVV